MNCSVGGCYLQAERVGMCSKHYTRWLRYGNVDTVMREHVGTDPDIPAPTTHNGGSQYNESLLSAAKLKDLLVYNPETGDFFWRTPGPGKRLDRPAGCVQSKKYWAIRIDGVLYLAHRLAWLYVTGRWPTTDIDHRDTNGQNNSIHNLRESDTATQIHNTNIRSDNSTGYPGVCFAKRWGTYNAYITVNKRRIHLGAFKTFEDAVAARKQAEAKYYG